MLKFKVVFIFGVFYDVVVDVGGLFYVVGGGYGGF